MDAINVKSVQCPVQTLMDEDPTPDLSETNSSILDDAMEINSDCDEFFINSVLAIPHIWERIFNNFTDRELFELRLVSKSWEEKISLTLMKRVDLLNPKNRCGLKYWDCKVMSDSDVWELCTLLAFSPVNPKLIFKNIHASSDWNRPTNFPGRGCPNLLKKFGHFVMSLEINKDLSLRILNELVLKEGSYCPNLEVLHFNASWPKSDKRLLPLPVFGRTLNLKKLIFRIDTNFGSPERLQLLHLLLKNSPQLVSLHIGTQSPISSLYSIELLEKLPEVTTKLTNLTLQGYVLPHLKRLCKVSFSRKLKSVNFIEQCEYDEIPVADPDAENRDLMDFLKLAGHSIETLRVDRHFHEDYSMDSFHEALKGIPIMPNLKEIHLDMYELDLNDEPDFFKKVPSLKVLNIYYLVHLEEFLERNSQSGGVYENLEKIELTYESFGSAQGDLHIYSPVTIQRMNQCFPNLSKFKMIVTVLPGGLSIVEVAHWFEQLFQAISKMKKLVELEVTFDIDDPNRPEGDLHLDGAFRFLKDSPSLEVLTFYRMSYKFPLEECLRELLDAPKLRELYFNEYEIDEKVAEDLVQEFAKENVKLVVDYK